MAWLPKSSVVVPVDFSDESMAAVDTALQLVDQTSAVHVIHVLPVLGANEPGVVWAAVDDESRSEHAQSALRERLKDPKYEGVEIAISFGDPGEEIAQFANNVKAELVVLPSHGRTGLKRLLIGSTAERVVRLSHCPVLVLRK